MFQTIYARAAGRGGRCWCLSLEWWLLSSACCSGWRPSATRCGRAARRAGVLGVLGLLAARATRSCSLPVLMLAGDRSAIACWWRARRARRCTSGAGGRGCSSRPCTWPSPWSAAGRATRRASRRSRSRRRSTTCAAPGSVGRARLLRPRASSALERERRSTARSCSKRLLALAAEHRWFVRIDPGWASHDVRFYGDRWCKTDLVTVTENHGGGRRLTRVRLRPAPTLFQKALRCSWRLRGGPRRGDLRGAGARGARRSPALVFWHVRGFRPAPAPAVDGRGAERGARSTA